MRYGSRSNTKKRSVKIIGSVRFALRTVRLKNGTVTVAIAVKNGHGAVRYGHGSADKFGNTVCLLTLLICKALLVRSEAG